MSDKKYIMSLDLDGTLLTSKNTIDNRTIEIINQIKNDYYIVIATGRSLTGLPVDLSNIRYDYIITSNGATLYEATSGNAIKSNWLQAYKAIEFIENFSNMDVIIECLIDGKWYIQDTDYNRLSSIICDKNITDYIFNTRYFCDDLLSYISDKKQDVEKITLNFNKNDVALKVKLTKEVNMIKDINYWYDKPHKIDIYSSNASKGQMLSYLSSLLGMSPENITAIGDSDNDVDMFEFVGTSVAMGNANSKIKEKAKFVTKSNDEGGVAEYILNIY